MRRRWGALGLIGLIMAVGLSGCAWFQRSGPQELRVTVRGGPRLNPDDQGRPLPTTVQLLQLRSAGKAETLDAGQLYGNQRQALGEDLLRVDELVVPPGGQVTRTLSREASAQAVAVVALLRRPVADGWRVVAPLRGADARALDLTVDEYRIARTDPASAQPRGGHP